MRQFVFLKDTFDRAKGDVITQNAKGEYEASDGSVYPAQKVELNRAWFQEVGPGIPWRPLEGDMVYSFDPFNGNTYDYIYSPAYAFIVDHNMHFKTPEARDDAAGKVAAFIAALPRDLTPIPQAEPGDPNRG